MLRLVLAAPFAVPAAYCLVLGFARPRPDNIYFWVSAIFAALAVFIGLSRRPGCVAVAAALVVAPFLLLSTCTMPLK
jgi:hypothetical protein